MSKEDEALLFACDEAACREDPMFYEIFTMGDIRAWHDEYAKLENEAQRDYQELEAKLGRLLGALESIAGWRNVNISSEYEHGLRDIIRSVTDCASAAIER